MNPASARIGPNADITSLTGLTTALSIAQGGTASTTAADARTALGAAASGANSDITSLMSGNVGIGGESTGSKLESLGSVNNSATVGGLDAASISIKNTNSAALQVKASTNYLLTDGSGTYGKASVYGLYSNYNSSADIGTALGFATQFNAAGGVVERMRIDSSGQLKTMVTGGTAVMDAYACRAWVNFNGTGTVAIRASGNVSSITDNGTGNYTVNFTTAMPDANYAVAGAGVEQAGGAGNLMSAVAIWSVATNLTTSCRINNANIDGAAGVDGDMVTVAIFR
jgi:hypothetical protein